MIPFRYQELISRQAPVILGLLLFAGVALFTERMVATQRQSDVMSVNIDLRNDLYTVREKIDESLSLLIYRSLGMTAYIHAKNGELNPGEVQAMLAALYANSRHVRSFGLAEDTTITFVYPTEGNKKALGKNYREIPDQWPEVLAAINSESGVLAGPVNLVQGGEALIFRAPIKVNGQYWGLLSTVIDVKSYLEDIASSRMFADSNLSIRTVQGDTRIPLYGDGSVFRDPKSQRVDVAVPGGYWELGLSSTRTRVDTSNNAWRILGWLMGLLLGLGVATILFQRRALQKLALVDELTGVANRRQFDLLLERSCEKYNRRNSGSFALLYVDLDKFKVINDVHGHRAGDYFLVELAKRARQAIRGGDLIARWGGDEFAIILDNPTQASVNQVVDRVRALCEQPVYWRGEALSVGASIGVVHYPEDGSTPDVLLGIADQKMYANKRYRQQANQTDD